MKKKYIIAIVVIIVVILLGIGIIVIKNTNENGKKYEIAKIENYNYFLLKQEDLYGVIDKTGKIVINAKYNEVKIPNPEKDVYICYEKNIPIVLNNKGERIFAEFEKVEPIRLKNVVSDLMYEKTVLIYSKNNKYGLLNIEGKKITENIYDSIETLPYKEGELLVKQQGKVGVINIKGNKIIDIKYDQISIDNYYQEKDGYKNAGYIVSNTTEEGYRYGYINTEGKEIIKPEYNELNRTIEIKDDNNAYFILAKNGQYGVYKNQDQIVKNEYQSIRYGETTEVFIIEKSKKYGVIDIQGNSIIPIEYEQIDVIGTNLYAKKGQETTVFNNKGENANIDKNIAILETENKNYKIKIDSNNNKVSYGVINEKGETLIPQEYNYIEYLFDNYFIVSNKEGKLGILDDKTNIKINIEYNSLQRLQGINMIQASNSQTKLTEIYSSKIEKISEIKNGTIEEKDNYIHIYNEEEIKYIDKKEEKEISNIEVFKENKLFTKKQNEKWGFIDNKGNTKVDFKYDKVIEFNKYGFAGIKKDGKWGVINESGEILVEPSYEIKNEKDLSFIGDFYSVAYGFGEIYYTK